MGDNALEQAEVAAKAARLALEKLDTEIRAEKAKAAAEIDKRYGNQRAAALDDVSATGRALVAAKDSLPDHPWTGKRVYKIERVYERWSSRVRSEIRHEGVVETRRSATTLPAKQRWGLPQLGEGFVRLLKKDGTPGAKIDSLSGYRSDWKLSEEQPHDR